MSSKTRQQLEAWLKTIDVKADRVLDIGGSQNPIKGRTRSWDVKDYKILDLEQPHECKQKPDFIADLNDKIYSNGKRYSGEKFDILFCMEVFEYLYRPHYAIRNMGTFLKQGGILYLSTHFIYPVHNPTWNDYMRYTPAGIEKLLEEAGFEIEENIARRAQSNKIMEFYAEEGMRPAKHSADHMIVGSLIKAIKK